MASLSGLRSLNLADNKVDAGWMGHGGTAWAPSLTGFTYLCLAKTNVSDHQLAELAPFLPPVTHLDLNDCTEITLLSPNYYIRPLEASLKALTHLSLASTKVGNEGMKTMATLTALALFVMCTFIMVTRIF
jgi:hypothetical protein